MTPIESFSSLISLIFSIISIFSKKSTVFDSEIPFSEDCHGQKTGLFYSSDTKRFAFAAAVFLAACQFQPSVGTVGKEKVYPRSELETAYGIPENVVVYTYLPPGYDAAPALGNGVGQEDGPPYCGGGFWIHPKIGFDIWDAGKASGVLETGIFFSYFGSVNMLCSVVDERSGTDTMLTFLMDKHVPSLNFSIGHRFEFPEDRSLFFGIYGLFGYAWAASDTRLSENKNTGLDFSQTGDRIQATAGAPVAALMADFGYRFSRYAGVFLSGAYIFNDGVMGNFLFGGGIRIYAF